MGQDDGDGAKHIATGYNEKQPFCSNGMLVGVAEGDGGREPAPISSPQRRGEEEADRR